MHSEYLISAPTANLLPIYQLPEFAFVGRSNCGKSSLLNALLNRKDLARTSRTPGRTQMVNFFGLNNKLIFADLPGYGFSATGRAPREHWQELMETYFARTNIKLCLFLVDSRRDVDDEDIELLSYIQEKQQVACVLTKVDKLNRQEIKRAQDATREVLADRGINLTRIFAVSSSKKTGIDELREFCFNPIVS